MKPETIESNGGTLYPVRSHWKNPKTVAVRVPESLKDQILAYARQLDAGDTPTQPSPVNPEAIAILEELLDTQKYKANAAGKMRKRIKEALEMLR